MEQITHQQILQYWKIRRDEIKAKYAEMNPDGTRKYSQRDLAKEYGVTDTRIYLILNDNKPPHQRKTRRIRG